MKLVTRFTAGTDTDILNRYFVLLDSTSNPTNADLNAWCHAVGVAWDAHLVALYNTNVTYEGSTAEDLSTPSSAVGIDGTAYGGTRSGGMLPAGVAAVVSHEIARRYRGGKPRSYLNAGSDSDLLSPQLWTTAFAAALLAGFNAWVAAVQIITTGPITGCSFMNISYYHGFTNFLYPSGRYKAIPTPRVVPTEDLWVNSKVNPNVASQRRRNQTP